MNFRKLLSNRDFTFFILAAALNLLLIVFIYQSVFSLEFQGDGWQYAWGHHIYYESNVFGELSLKGMRTSLGGASLTFGLIENNFGLNAVIFYTFGVFFKFLSVIAFFLLVKKLTQNNIASLVASLILSATFVGVEATHWVFNMYAYIGLTFIILAILAGIDLPQDFKVKKWLLSFLLACAGVWYATMRTNGIIPLILIWSLYHIIFLKSKDGVKNLIYWMIGFAIFIVIDKFLLGQMESDYSQKYIIDQGINAFNSLIAIGKYDFLLSPASNLGSVILPDITWSALNFPKNFSFLGASLTRTVILPSFLIYLTLAWVITKAISEREKNSWGFRNKFGVMFLLGFLWTVIVYAISKIGPPNFSSWEVLVLTLAGGYFLVSGVSLVIIRNVPSNLKVLFLFSFFWFFLFLLLPEFQNGGPLFGTYHRYMATTAPSVSLFMAGLITLGLNFKSLPLKALTFVLVVAMIFSHATSTKSFFDRKALVHNRQVSTNIWSKFMEIVPNKPEYIKKPPALYFEAADNRIDQETLFESLYFGFPFRASLNYQWDLNSIASLYNNEYQYLLRDIKKNPKLMDDLYAVRVENQSLIDITDHMKQKIAKDIK